MNFITDYTEWVISWPAYFIGIMVFTIFWVFVSKLLNGSVDVQQLVVSIFLALFNPLWYFIIPMIVIIGVAMIPFAWFGFSHWNKIKDKKIL